MKRLIGLDYGQKKIGLAVSDPFGMTAQSLGVLRNQSHDDVFKSLREYLQKYDVEGFVVGLPKNMNGTEGPAAATVKEFGSVLEKNFDLPVHYIDERLTSVQIERTLIDANVRRRKRKEIKDQLEAVLILQSYLDRNAG